MTGSPFGKFATAVAAIAALGILGTWLASQIGLVESTPTLDTTALVVVGVIFGVGAGAAAVANGATAQAHAANVRLDALGAPGSAAATEILHGAHAVTRTTTTAEVSHEASQPPTPPSEGTP